MIVEKSQQKSSVDVNKKKDFINCLDYDSLARIFMLLPIPERLVMEEVCTRWEDISKLAWHDIKKYKCGLLIGRTYNNQLLTQSYVETILLRCGVYLKELVLSKVCDSSIIPVVGNHCKNLTTLEFVLDLESEVNNTNQYVQAFTQLNILKSIKIKVFDRIFHKCPCFLPKIINSLPEEINEIHLCYYGDSLINFSLKKFKNLHSLTLRGCKIDNILQEISEKTTLVHLDLQYSFKFEEKYYLLFNQLVYLEHISIDIIPIERRITETLNALKILSKKCKNLKYLDMPFTSWGSTKIQLVIWPSLKYLEHINLTWNMTDDLAIKLLKYCKNLKELELKFSAPSELLTETGLTKWTELENLERLKISYVQNLSDETIIAITNNCEKLKHLNLIGCTIVQAIDGTPLSSTSILDRISKLQYLEHVDLSHIKNLEDSTVIAIADKCKHLIQLNLSQCKKISETALLALTSLKRFQKLDVSYNPNITNNFIGKLKNFKYLRCFHCPKITKAGVIQFIKNCPDLEDLYINEHYHAIVNDLKSYFSS